MTRRTVRRPAEVAGTGLHTGAEVHLRLIPAAGGQGIVFRRLDRRSDIPASLACVVASDRRTTVGRGGDQVDTVEHLMAAVAAYRIDDLIVELDGPELPILDGSFQPFVALLERAGVQGSPGWVGVYRIEAPFEVVDGDAWYAVRPAPRPSLAVELEYAQPVIGTQSATYGGDTAEFVREIAPARTYGFDTEIAALRARGLLAGAGPGVAVVVSETAPLNTTLRWPNEFARHKLGDLLGDLALLGARLAAEVRARRPSHRGNLACARAIAARARFVEEA